MDDLLEEGIYGEISEGVCGGNLAQIAAKVRIKTSE